MEIWKQVKGFEGLYEVSNLGNVRSLNYHNWGITKNLTPTADKCGTRNTRISKSKRNTKCKTVIQMDLQGNVIREWVSLNEVMRVLGFNAAFVARCCHGVKPTAYGYKWRYAT